MARVRGNGGIRHIQKTLGNDPSYFEAVEVLVPHLHQNSFQRILDLLRSESAKEHHLCFCRHEEEVPSSSVDLAIKREAIERSEEHTSELQSRFDLVCRLLLEKKKKKK